MAKFTSLFAGAIAVSALAACSKTDSVDLPAGMVTRNNFENVQGWGGVNEVGVTTEKAHSGKSCIWVNPQVQYSYTYSRVLSQMTNSKPKKLTVEGWAWVPEKGSSASIILEIKHSPYNNSMVYYDGMDLTSTVGGFKSWKKVKKTFTLPDSVASGNAVKVYMFGGNSKAPVYFDDLAISLDN